MVKTSKSKFGLERSEAVEALKAFLDETNEAKVFALKGEWGIGKTDLVKKFLLASKKANSAYVQIRVLKQQNFQLQQARDLLLLRLMNGGIAV